MTSTGVVRRIDDLGRIVIPKEIRKSLGIRDGENLEILVEDNNIKMIKRNIISNFAADMYDMCLAASDILSGTIIFTDREKVTNVVNDEIKVGDKISFELSQMIDHRMLYNEEKLVKHKIGNKEFSGYFLIYPIIDDGDSLGLVILYDKEKSVKEYELLIKFMARVLSRKLDITW